MKPFVKSVLRKHNKLTHKRQFNRANELRSKIGKLIAERSSEGFSNVNPRSSKDLWPSAKPVIKNYYGRSSLGTKYGCMFDDVYPINAYVADQHYDSQV
jgi:CRISPR/Cas system-associated protein Csm6